jgi:glycosyltransferase involved in cell wall biosynthesis
MKILFPYLARWRSANRSRYHQLLTHLCGLGHQVYVLTAPEMAVSDISARDLETGCDALPAGISVAELYSPDAFRSFWKRRIPGTKLFKKGVVSITSINQVRRFISTEKIDVLLAYNLPQAPLLHLAECRTHFDIADDLVAMMQVEHEHLAGFGVMAAARAVQRFMVSRADTVTVASSVLENQIGRRSLMLPNGADVAELDKADGGIWRARHDGPTVGFVGAFEYWVNFDLILRMALAMPRVTFLLVGGGRQWQSVRDEVASGGISNVHLTGAIPYRQAMDYVAGMDVCLLPFKHGAVSDGSCPLKLFEYAALRKPIVSTATREVKSIGNGWIEFADDEKEFQAAVESLLADPRAARRAGETGRALVEKLYNWPVLARQFEEFLIKGAVPAFQPAIAHRMVLETLKSGFGPLP